MKLVVIIGLILICATCKKEVADYRDKWCGIYNTKTVYFGKHYFYDSISKDWSSKIGYDTMYGYSILVKDLKYNDGVAIQFSSTIDFNPNSKDYIDTSINAHVNYLPDSLEKNLLYIRVNEIGLLHDIQSLNISLEGNLYQDSFYLKTRKITKYDGFIYLINSKKVE